MRVDGSGTDGRVLHTSRRRPGWKTLRGARALSAALGESSRESVWIVTGRAATGSLLAAIRAFVSERRESGPHLGTLLMLAPASNRTASVLCAVFDRVIGAAPPFVFLPQDELLEAVASPVEVARDVLIGGSACRESALLLLVRGDLRTIVAPFELLRPSGDAAPDFRRLAFTDHGHTVRLGAYEASADAILYEVDPAYRRRLNARRRATEKGFGPALRRLRKQRGLARTDFPGLSAKTLARLERGEIRRPHARTVAALERRLGMSRQEIGSF